MFWFMILVLVILFWGEPDVYDRLMERDECDGTSAEECDNKRR